MRNVRSRFVLTTALVLLLGATIATASLIPAFISVRLAIQGLPESTPLSQTAQEDQEKNTRALALVAALSPITNATSTPSEALTAALTAKPAGVSITSMTYSAGKLVLAGGSGNRQAVNAYREALEADATFSSVTVPVAALVGSQDGRFTITLTGAF